MDDWRQYIGKRVLIKGPWKSANPKEVLIEEISRDGSHIKVKWKDGKEYWLRADVWRVVEVRTMDDWKKYIGKRVLIRKFWSSGDYPKEVIIKELSPNGTHVKLKWPSGSEGWVRTSNWDIVEVLEGAADPSNEAPRRGSETFRASTR